MRDDARAVAASPGDDNVAAHPPAEAPRWDELGAIMILLVAGAPVHDWFSDQSLVPVVFRALWWLTYLAAAARLFQQFGTDWLRWMIRRQTALCLLLLLTFASALWSLDPLLTVHKAASLAGTTLVAVWIGYVSPPERMMRVLFWTFTVLILASLAVAVTLPQPVANAQPFAWRGIMGNRNSFGAGATLATASFLIVTLRRQVHPLWGLILCAAGILAIAQARSRTPFVALNVALLAWVGVGVAAIMRRSVGRLVRVLSVVLLLGVSVVPFLVGLLLSVPLKRDPLNGRTAIWNGAVTMVRERPLTGYGYAVVWGRGEATLLPHIDVTAQPWAVNAHNSILNIASEVGMAAALVACVYVVGALSDAGRLCDRAPSPFALCALVSLIAITVMGFAESQLLQIHSMFWMLVVALTVAVRRSLDGGMAGTRLEAQP